MLVGVAIVDFMFFGKRLGVLSSTLSFDGGMQFAPAELWGNLLAAAAVAPIGSCSFPPSWNAPSATS